MFRLIVPFPILALLALASAASAQRSILDLVPAREPLLQPGAALPARFGESAVLALDDTPLEAWLLRGTPGQTVTIELISQDLDPILYVTGPGLVGHLVDDDGAGNCNARITLTLTSAEPYRVVAGAVAEVAVGSAFELRVLDAPGSMQPGICAGSVNGEMAIDDLEVTGTIEPGQTLRSTLDALDQMPADAPLEVYQFTLEREQSVWIGMVAESFDAFLHLFSGPTEIAFDDDGGGGCNALIAAGRLAPGRYRVVATAVSGAASGAYQLTIATSPLEAVAGECAGTDGWNEEALEALAVGDRTLRPGAWVSGHLDEASAISGMSVQVWTLEDVVGRTLAIRATAPASDLMLAVWGPGVEPITDDDSGPGCDPRLVVTFPVDAPYRVLVGNVQGTTPGLDYRIWADTSTAAVADTPCGNGGGLPSHVEAAIGSTAARGALRLGRSAEGRINRGAVDAWDFSARAHESVTFELLSQELDAFIAIDGAPIGTIADDDGGGGCNARVEVTFPADGRYVIYASSVDGNGGGYVLRASREAGPPASGSCGG